MMPKPPFKNVVVDGLWEEVRGPYSEEEMIAYGRAVAEACAAICDHEKEGGRNDGDESWEQCAEWIADAIREAAKEIGK